MAILIDTNQVFISSLMAQLSEDKSLVPDENLCRHMILSSTLHFKQKFGSDFGDLIFCDDDKNYWRKDLFPFYKSHRKRNRDQSKYDWNVIFSSLDTIKEEIKNHFPYKFIKVNKCEADDIIATISKLESEKNTPILILSNDRDFIQLQKYPNVKQYSLKQKRFLITDDPKKYLLEKVLSGDDGDGIPNFLSDDDALANPDKRQKPMYKKKLVVWSEEKDINKITEGNELLKSNIIRNAKLIDFNYIPKEIEQSIISEYNKEPPPKRDFLKYFMTHNLRMLLKHANEF